MFAFAAAVLIAALAAAWFVPLPGRLAIPGSRVIEYADATPMCVFLSGDDKWRIPVSIEDVDPDYITALIQYEDKRFYRHPGVDPIAVGRAIIQNLSERRVVSGASTITMQLVRLLEPRPRTFQSKFIEMLRAMQLELHLSKREILEYYLQFLPFGKNVEGIEAAAHAYFGHRAGDLSAFEIAYLLSVPQSPSDRYPTAEHVEDAKTAIAGVARRLEEAGAFDEREAREASAGRPPASLEPFPRDAMHVAQYLAGRYPEMRVRSSIGKEAQSLLENVLASYRSEFESMGIHNATAIVIDNNNGRVIAAVGNLDFGDDAHQGQVVGFMAPRSPGSAMKPFIYALAIDKGLALPGYLVADVPVRFRGYEPINYDRKYRGVISLENALSKSLNIPFINLLNEVNLPEYLAFLKDAGITTLVNKPDYYGLSIAVGGIEVRPAELTNMFAMLARNGEYRRLAWTLEEKSVPRQLISPGAAYLTRQALEIRDRPDFPDRRRASPPVAHVFWKTGTSTHHRDAWALGGNLRYTAGVWVGNFDSKPNRYLVGSRRAGPILFDIIEGLPQDGGSAEPDRPTSDLIPVEVCAFSGRIANKHCPHRKTVLALRTKLPTGLCPYHVEYWVDKKTGHRLNPLCREGRDAELQVFTVLPASVRRWIGDIKLDAPAPPTLLPTCPHVSRSSGLKILSPKHNAVFFLIPGLKADQQEIPLEAEAGADVGELFWFVDGRFLASSAPHERVWLPPSPGKHEVRVIDASGRSDTVEIKIMPPG